jgi:TetR/AcrR family tetracycline transcriptional repressor
MPPKTRQRLTRDRITEAALRLIDDEGVEAVSMRRVAREVGVEAMSLYHHVRDKEDLLEAVAERVMREFDAPPRDTTEWSTYGRSVAHAWRRLLKAHPNAIELFAERHAPTTEPAALLPMETALAALREAGLSDRDAVQAFHVFGSYIFGFVLMETGRLFGSSAGDDQRASFQPSVLVELPSIATCLPFLVECDFDEQFEFGLDLLIEGLRARSDFS